MSIERIFIWLLIVPSFLLHILKAERDFSIRTEYYECRHFNPEIFKSVNCHVEKRNNRNKMFASMVLVKSVQKFFVHDTIYVYRAKRSPFKMFDLKYNGCQLLHIIQEQSSYRTFLKNVDNFTNELPSCPLKAGFNYTLSDYYLDENNFPTYMPEMTLKTFVEVTQEEHGTKVLEIRSKIIVAPKNKLKGKRKKSE